MLFEIVSDIPNNGGWLDSLQPYGNQTNATSCLLKSTNVHSNLLASIKEFIDFTSKYLVERTNLCTRSSVKEQEYICHVYVRQDGLSGVVMADGEYPQRVAHSLINKVLDEFYGLFPPARWSSLQPSEVAFSELNEYLEKYQNPKEADAMTKIQTELDETKIILHNTIESVLQRGEKLDDLIEKSECLSMQSKAFYKTAKKTNQCCVIL